MNQKRTEKTEKEQQSGKVRQKKQQAERTPSALLIKQMIFTTNQFHVIAHVAAWMYVIIIHCQNVHPVSFIIDTLYYN